MSPRTETSYKAERPGEVAQHTEAQGSGRTVDGGVVQLKFAFLSGEIWVTGRSPQCIDAPAAFAGSASYSAVESADGGNIVGLDNVYAAGTLLVQDAARTTQLRLTGNVAEAEALVEQIVPLFREYRLQLEALAAAELDQVATLREQANSTAQLTVLLLIALGAAGQPRDLGSRLERGWPDLHLYGRQPGWAPI